MLYFHFVIVHFWGHCTPGYQQRFFLQNVICFDQQSDTFKIRLQGLAKMPGLSHNRKFKVLTSDHEFSLWLLKYRKVAFI